MEGTPKISVIVPVYNVEDYLADCLDSILVQDFSDYEILVVDDGSKDKSGIIADQYAEKYPDKMKVIHQQNRGLGGARDTGIENAKGKYFLFIDSDDTVEPDMFSGMWREVEEKNPQIVICGFHYVDEQGKSLSKFVNRQPKYQLLQFSEHRDIMLDSPAACNKLFHRDLFVQTGIRFPSRVWYEDVRTTTKLYPLAQGIVVMDRCYYQYLQRTGSIMQNTNLERNLEILDAFDDIIGYYKEQGFYQKYKKELEFLAIEHILFYASVRILKADPKSKYLNTIMEYMKKHFPDFPRNPYLKTLGIKHKIIHFLIFHEKYQLAHLMFQFSN